MLCFLGSNLSFDSQWSPAFRLQANVDVEAVIILMIMSLSEEIFAVFHSLPQSDYSSVQPLHQPG